ncbi:putative glycosyltransferase [Sphingomonas changbaiensis NBRC 104936]|uniref:Putative glycosyltransferase n=1 Tax=Sphingomonas changbaiensis NBRC 104936 TaxID=1219043 RepID=A0A0E9MPJ5_9SPHN|nr:sugar transferase [Sphingomonas changbaiensis]GAO39045.1 putative glycosyltransferase [Sphingomonas changbaiensis NBRC 104936]
MTKRALDVLAAAIGLAIFALPLAVILALVWGQDRKSPLYFGERAGRDDRPFRMVKVRSMVVNADRTGVESTGADDARITPLGAFVRRYKLDELPQLWNVLVGDMSLVGPRPNTMKAVASYSEAERGLLATRPGITDLSSIVFSDEGEIIKDSTDPDAAYDRLIRPWKSELGLLYVRHAGLVLDLKLIWLTIVAIVDKPGALRRIVPIVQELGAPDRLVEICRRDRDLAVYAREAHA